MDHKVRSQAGQVTNHLCHLLSHTRVGALPLLPEVAHEWSTMLTVMLQASQLKSLVVGQDHPTVITFDMALYEKAVQLLDARPNLKKEVVPRLGELHAVMAALRALGTSKERTLASMMHGLRQIYMGPLQQDISSSAATTREQSMHTSTRTCLCMNLLWNNSS